MMMMLMLMIRLRLMLMMMSRLAATTLAPDNISHQRHTHPYDAPHYDPAFPFFFTIFVSSIFSYASQLASLI